MPTQDLIDPMPLVKVAAMLSLAVCAAFAVLTYRRIGQSTAHPAMLRIALLLGSFATTMIILVTVLDATNRLMDRSPPVTHEARVLAKFAGNGRSRSQIIVRDWHDGGTSLPVFGINPDIFVAAAVGDSLGITTRSGFWGYERMIGYRLAKG